MVSRNVSGTELEAVRQCEHFGLEPTREVRCARRLSHARRAKADDANKVQHELRVAKL
ncbi:hypothetical protein FRC09_016757, partial [Ceratobasidium sp. 395]